MEAPDRLPEIKTAHAADLLGRHDIDWLISEVERLRALPGGAYGVIVSNESHTYTNEGGPWRHPLTDAEDHAHE